MSDQEPQGPVDGAQLIIDAVAAANEPELPAHRADAPAEPAAPVDGQGDGQRLYAGKYTSVEELERGYQNIEPEFTRRSMQVSELERRAAELEAQLQQYSQQPKEPEYSPLSFGFTEPTSVEELYSFAEKWPDKTALWAMENAQRLEPEHVQQVVNYWHQVNPAQATAHTIDQMMRSYLPQVQQQVAPIQERHQEQLLSSAVDRAQQAIGPSYGDYQPRIVEYLEANPNFIPEAAYTNPDLMASTLVNVYAMLVGHDQLAQGQAIASQGIPPGNPAAATMTASAGTSTTTDPTGAQAAEDEIAAQIQALILSGGRTPRP